VIPPRRGQGAATFTAKERAYLNSQRLARIASVSPAGQPDVAPVGYEWDGDQFAIGGFDLTRTLKYRNVLRGNARIALVVDDLASMEPWTPRGVKIHGSAAIVETARGPALRIAPLKKRRWRIERPAFSADGPVSARAVRTNPQNPTPAS